MPAVGSGVELAASPPKRRRALTGVLTRTAFFEQAALLTTPTSPPYAVLMLDIDHFKTINDTYGHAAGDVTLAHAGRLLAGAVRLCDIVGRYGGEEFSILLRNADVDEVSALAQRIVADAGRRPVRLADGRSLSYTVSVGYAVGDSMQGAEPFSDVIERADQAPFRAKREGRNRAVPALPRSTVTAEDGCAARSPHRPDHAGARSPPSGLTSREQSRAQQLAPGADKSAGMGTTGAAWP